MKKISLKDVKNSLKRDEMRAISGGCGAWGQCAFDAMCLSQAPYGFATCYNGRCVH
jgi:hypothetical protein